MGGRLAERGHATWYELTFQVAPDAPEFEGLAKQIYELGDIWRAVFGPVAGPLSGDPLDVFNPNVYHGGALVLYALRQQVGDAAFRRDRADVGDEVQGPLAVDGGLHRAGLGGLGTGPLGVPARVAVRPGDAADAGAPGLDAAAGARGAARAARAGGDPAAGAAAGSGATDLAPWTAAPSADDRRAQGVGARRGTCPGTTCDGVFCRSFARRRFASVAA